MRKQSQAEYESKLDYLLRFINGKIDPFEIGFASYPLDSDTQGKQLHKACLELERRGQVERWFECSKIVVWRPVSIIVTDN